MQWLIDIAIEAMKNWIYENGIFRPNLNSGYTWTLSTLTTDMTWRYLDCSDIVDEHAKAVLIHAKVKANNIGWALFMRGGQETGFHATCGPRPQIAGVDVGGHYVIPLDSDRRFQYRATAGVWTLITISVKAWWM